MAPEVQGRGLLRGGKEVGVSGRCTCFRAQVPLQCTRCHSALLLAQGQC